MAAAAANSFMTATATLVFGAISTAIDFAARSSSVFCRRVEPGGTDQQGHRGFGARPRMQGDGAAHTEIKRRRRPFQRFRLNPP